MIRLLVDSSSDYSLTELKEQNIEQVSLSLLIDDQHYKGGVDLAGDDFYVLLQNSQNFPKTSQPSPQDFVEIFSDVQEKGDSMICILLSSQLSGTWQSAHLAKDIVDYENIYIIDSLACTHLIRIMADHADKLRRENRSVEEIIEAVEQLKGRVRVIAGVDTLEYLYRGGRLSRTSAAIGELTNLKPIVTLSKEGTISVAGKCLGRVKALSFIMKYIQGKQIDTDFPIYSVYTYGTENCEKLEEKLAKENFTITKRVQVGSTIGSHVGPGAFGVIFVEK